MKEKIKNSEAGQNFEQIAKKEANEVFNSFKNIDGYNFHLEEAGKIFDDKYRQQSKVLINKIIDTLSVSAYSFSDIKQSVQFWRLVEKEIDNLRVPIKSKEEIDEKQKMILSKDKVSFDDYVKIKYHSKISPFGENGLNVHCLSLQKVINLYSEYEQHVKN
jgi:hypothetical protein